MSPDFSDPTPVTGQLESYSYQPPRLRITATYDRADGPTSLEVEIHDENTPSPEAIRQIVTDVAGALASLDSPTRFVPVTSTTSAGRAEVTYSEVAA